MSLDKQTDQNIGTVIIHLEKTSIYEVTMAIYMANVKLESLCLCL